MIYGVFAILMVIAGYFTMEKTEAPTSNDSMNPDNKFDSLFKKYGDLYGVPWKILKRMAYIESTLGQNPRVAKGLKNPQDINGSISTDGLSWGLMQMTLSTARDYDSTTSASKLNDPDYSIKLGAQHTKMLLKYFPIGSDNYERNIVMAYNHGQGNQLKFVKAEQAKTLKATDYPQARNHWAKYEKARGIFP